MKFLDPMKRCYYKNSPTRSRGYVTQLRNRISLNTFSAFFAAGRLLLVSLSPRPFKLTRTPPSTADLRRGAVSCGVVSPTHYIKKYKNILVVVNNFYGLFWYLLPGFWCGSRRISSNHKIFRRFSSLDASLIAVDPTTSIDKQDREPQSCCQVPVPGLSVHLELHPQARPHRGQSLRAHRQAGQGPDSRSLCSPRASSFSTCTQGD